MEERKINWLSLFIKAVIIFIFIIIVIWLITKIINKNKLSENFISNINSVQEKSKEYFKTIDLPLEKGKNIKITLKEMLEKDLLKDEDKNLKNTCDLNESYSKIIREKEEYKIETTLKCGKEKDTITTDFNLKDCKNCNQNNNKQDNEINNNKNNNDNKSEQNKETTITYYEHVKETTTYTKWMKGNKTGNNVENRFEYYLVDTKEYYSVGMINKKDLKNNEITYTLKLKNIPDSKKYFTLMEESSYYDLSTYSEESNIILKNKNNINIDEAKKYVLDKDEFTYKLQPYYRKGNFYVDITVKISEQMNKKSYLIPIKFIVKFVSGEITNTKPEGDYETISYYRYIEKNREVIWSTENYVEGYTKTGQTKIK